MSLDKSQLMGFLKVVDGELERKIRLNAAGGTALTLLGVKSATIDVDFDMNVKDDEEFKGVLGRLNPGFKVDRFTNGYIFSQQLPEDYLGKCTPIRTSLKNIDLYSIAPVDVIVSKAGRLIERDIQDIKIVIQKFGITKRDVMERSKKVEYTGRQENYDQNIKYILDHLY